MSDEPIDQPVGYRLPHTGAISCSKENFTAWQRVGYEIEPLYSAATVAALSQALHDAYELLRVTAALDMPYMQQRALFEAAGIPDRGAIQEIARRAREMTKGGR